ncbi:MAG TPA: Na/Pi symporter [Burkholderiaceae bacterium]|nr:Na/Pi symporter [Burkholderiaceae bacterium]
MVDVVFRLLGGIGLFLLGMSLLSEGLVGFAGAALRRYLLRFTGTPWRAFVSGALTTVLIQSSTATTVTLIGFVSAGLIGYSQAIGVVIGASLGTTATGWFVASLGLKINLGYYTLPLIGLGAFLRVLGHGRWRHMGLACAGFGMLFLGLSGMQEGMQGLANDFDLKTLPSSGVWAHVLAMLVGVVLTTLLQSSTAAVATTLTALHAGTLVMEQAASIVVGAAIGTTLTGALVTIGGTVAAKRTALAHILFNLGSGLVAIVLLPVFLGALDWLHVHAGLEGGAMSLAVFHTLFIAVGVALFMPGVGHFERLVARLLPERKQDMGRHLDASSLGVPAVALEASQRSLESITHQLVEVQRNLLSRPMDDALREILLRAHESLNEALQFIARLPPLEHDPGLHRQRVAQLHAIDHLLRLCGRLQADSATLHADEDADLASVKQQMDGLLALVHAGLDGRAEPHWQEVLQRKGVELAVAAQGVRARLLESDRVDGGVAHALQLTDALRSLERSATHVLRTCHYLLEGRQAPVTIPGA